MESQETKYSSRMFCYDCMYTLVDLLIKNTVDIYPNTQ